jgi:hypothetical protein
VIPNQLILAMAVPFDEPSRNDGEVYRAEQFARFLDLFDMDPPLAMLRDHDERELIGPRWVTGWWYAFSAVPTTSVPSGLLALGVFSNAPAGQARLAQVREAPGEWSVSVRFQDASDAEDRSQLYLRRETSLTRDPALPSARVLGVGPDAATRWELLTNSPVPDLPIVGWRTRTSEQVTAVVGGRVVRASWDEPIWRHEGPIRQEMG